MITELEDYVKNNFCVTDNLLLNHLVELYSVYSTYYIKDFNDFKLSSKKFADFLRENIDFLIDISHTSSKKMNKCCRLAEKLLEGKIANENVHKEQAQYVEIVKQLAPSRDSHILDVGPGNVPYSSILMGQTFAEVSAMDKEFWLSKDSLKSMNVNAIDGLMTKNTSVDAYDMVVGRFPCSAIDYIVYLCNKNKKPYFIETCDCEMPMLDYFYKKWGINKKVNEIRGSTCTETKVGVFDCVVNNANKEEWKIGWEKPLKELDKDICFSGRYAYNVGIDNYEVDKIIELTNN